MTQFKAIKTYKVSPRMVPVVVLGGLAITLMMVVWFLYMCYQASIMTAYYTSFHPIITFILLVIFLGSVTVKSNGTESVKAILPAKIRNILGFIVIGFTFYYLSTVEFWSDFELAFLAAPIIYTTCFRFFKFLSRK